jgi:hypothetical protein
MITCGKQGIVQPNKQLDDYVLDRGSEELLLTAGDPCTLAEAEKEKVWQCVMIEELASIEENNTWSLVDPVPGHRLIGMRLVYKLKDSNGAIVNHKARLVGKGYVQQQGIDFKEVFAPVARLESVWLMLSLSARRSWAVHHMDVSMCS